MSGDWEDWFESKIGGDLPGYARSRWVYNLPIFQTFARHWPNGARVVEAGSGAGLFSIQMSRLGYDITGVDQDPKMLGMARRNAELLGGGTIRFVEGSVLDLSEHYGKYDVAYSCGVMEHFYHDDAVKMLQEKSKCAPRVLVYVPSHWAWRNGRHRAHGIFERYTISRLRKVVRDAGLETIEELGFSAGSRPGRAFELLCPPILARPAFLHLAATIGVLARSPGG